MKYIFVAALMMLGCFSTPAFAEGDFFNQLFGAAQARTAVAHVTADEQYYRARRSHRTKTARYDVNKVVANYAATSNVHHLVTQAALAQGVPPAMMHAVVQTESRYNCHARNRSGAAGLGQLMPRTARGLGVRNVYDCAENARGVASYLASAIRTHGLTCAAASAYNAGLGYRGCSAYGRKIMAAMGRARYASFR